MPTARMSGIVRWSLPVSLAASLSTAVSPADAAVVPTMSVTITTTSTYHRVCADAAISPGSTNVFTFHVVGARTGGSAITYTPLPTIATTFHDCYTVTKDNSPSGDYEATVTSAGSSGQAPFAQTGNGSWLNGVDRVIVTSGG